MKNIICRHFQKELFPKLKFAYNNIMIGQHIIRPVKNLQTFLIV